MRDEFISGGYFIIKSAQRAGYMNNKLLPDKIISVSECICDVLPSTWALTWVKKRKEDIDRANGALGLSQKEFHELERWVTEKFDEGKIGWQNGFANLSTAREFYSRFMKSNEDVYLLGIGLSKEDADIFLDEEKPGEGMGGTLVYSVLQRNELIDTSGFIGFDVLGYDIGSFHSYICNGLEEDFFKVFGISPNKYGLYDSYISSKQAAEYLNNEEIGAEPALWQSWVVCRFEISE